MVEVQFDGLVGPTHNYAGLSFGNTASIRHGGESSNPKRAALEGLVKMKFVHDLGVPQAVLPPQFRPHLPSLRQMGFTGSGSESLRKAMGKDSGFFLRLCSSASSMWSANAATVMPSSDTEDGKVSIVPANLSSMFHRALEAATTARVFRRIFSNEEFFRIADPLPSGSHFSDEGAANHTRLETSKAKVHLFAWGRSAWKELERPRRFPARQTLEASEALIRLHRPQADVVCLLPKQSPLGIDAGAFHTDVLAVGNLNFFMAHELAFENQISFLENLKTTLGNEFELAEVNDRDLPATQAVQAYPFNSQILSLSKNSMCIIAPNDAEEDLASHRFLSSLVHPGSLIQAIHFLSVRQSMQNGGGPACLRLRVPLETHELDALGARVLFDLSLFNELKQWVERNYRDELAAGDLADPKLLEESMKTLDELTQILRMGSIYEFQRI